MKKYRCPDCGQVVERDSNKKQIKSYCSVTGKTVKIKRIGMKWRTKVAIWVRQSTFPKVKFGIKGIKPPKPKVYNTQKR